MTDPSIGPILGGDRERWLELWHAYLAFYATTLADEVTASTWSRVVGGQGPIAGIGARYRSDTPLIGFANYTLHANSWSAAPVCYLEDLFVDPGERGRGIGRALIAAVVDVARRQGASRVYWQTQSGNITARRLYDSVATLTDFVKYEIRF